MSGKEEKGWDREKRMLGENFEEALLKVEEVATGSNNLIGIEGVGNPRQRWGFLRRVSMIHGSASSEGTCSIAGLSCFQ